MFPIIASLQDSWYNPPGSWNQLRIIAFDSNYVHYGNGKKLLEYKIGTPEFVTAYAKSKYSDDGNAGRYYDIHPGSIMLQHHGEIGVTFRTIKAKELTVNPLKQDFKDGKWPEELPANSVLGVTTGLASAGAPGLPGIASAYAGQGAALVTVTGGHDSFEANAIDGRALPVTQNGEGAYRVGRGTASTGIAIVRVRAGGRTATKIIDLP